MRVLIADDDPTAREALGALVECWGNEVFFCADGAEAIAAASWFSPNIIILDLEMPIMDGISAARQLRELYPAATWCLIAYTGRGSNAQREATRAAGFTEHFCKPSDLGKLERILDTRYVPRQGVLGAP
ncbi:response regulator [Cupriavidus sp. CuC1]|uniref:response regulator n=1 Tax=Cupriavidus sp. CuC1 TaxID=3373131 RepID=UPI0037D94711